MIGFRYHRWCCAGDRAGRIVGWRDGNGGLALMAGMMGTPIGWVALIVIGLLALGGNLYFFAGG